MSERLGGQETANLNLAAAADGMPSETERPETSSAAGRELVEDWQAVRYVNFLERLARHRMRGELSDEDYQQFRSRLRVTMEREIGADQARELFEARHPSARMLAELVMRLERQGVQVVELAAWDQYELRDGLIYGEVRTSDDRWLPIVGNDIVERAGVVGDPEDYYSIWSLAGRPFFPGGKLTGTVDTRFSPIDNVAVARLSPVWQGAVQTTIDDLEIHEGRVTDATEAGWSGWVELVNDSDRDRSLPVHNGQLRREMAGRPIKAARGIHDQAGKMSGLVALETADGKEGPYQIVIQDELITSVGQVTDYEIGMHEWVTFQELDGKEVWNGTITSSVQINPQSTRRSSVNHAVIAGQICREIDGARIDGARSITLNERGEPSGVVHLRNTPGWLPVINGKIHYEIDGRTIHKADECEFRNGTWNGYVQVDDHEGPRYPVWHGKLVTTWHGRALLQDMGAMIFHEIDGTVNGTVIVQKGDDVVTERLILEPPPPELR